MACQDTADSDDPPKAGRHGVILTAWGAHDYEQVVTDTTLDHLSKLGVDTVAIIVTRYQATAKATQIARKPAKTPTDEALCAVIAAIRHRGLAAVLKPHVDIDDGTWRGAIGFADESAWQEWFSAYGDYLEHAARLAQRTGVVRLVVGTELKGTTGRVQQWRALIERIRVLFDGELVYAANWDHYTAITWWDALDHVGVDAYFPLATSTSPTEAELVASWGHDWTRWWPSANRWTGRC